MSDTDFVDVGDELIVRISGYPVGRARVQKVHLNSVFVCFDNGDTEMYFHLPLDVKSYDTVDGVAHDTL